MPPERSSSTLGESGRIKMKSAHGTSGAATPINELDGGVRLGPAPNQQQPRQQRDAQRQRGGVRFDGGRGHERAERQRATNAPVTPSATQIAVNASATPSVMPPASVPSSCQLGASTAVSVAASASRGDRRGVGSDKLERAMNEPVGDGARQREPERADPAGAQQAPAQRQERQQLGERGRHDALGAARHEPERAHDRQVVAPLPGRRGAQHGDDQRHRERQLARTRPRGTPPCGPRGSTCFSHRPWLPEPAKKAQFSRWRARASSRRSSRANRAKTAGLGGSRRRPNPQIQGKSSGPLH